MKQTVTARVIGAYTVIAFAGIIALGATTFLSLAHGSRHRALTELEALAELAVSLARASLAPEDLARAVSDIALGDSTVILLAADGTITAASGPYPRLPLTAPAITSLERSVSGFIPGARTGTASAFAIAPVGSADARLGYFYLSRPVGGVPDDARATAIAILVAAAVLSVITGMLAYRTLHWITKPIYAIRGAARRYAMGELTLQLRTDGPPELRQLADDLNQMALELRRRLGAISEQRNQLEVVLASMVEGVIVLDERRYILRMNEAAGRLLGVGVNESHGRTLIGHLRNAQLDELAEKAFLSDQPSEHTITVYRERPLHLQVHATPLSGDHTPTPTGSLLVMSDITRLKHLEDLRKDFVANVSHELKTPITSIKGFVETLLDDEEIDKPNRDRFLNIILNHSNRLHFIIEDLLSLSRLEQGDHRITFSRFAVRELMSNVVDLTRRAAEDKKIPIEVTIEGEPTAWGNPNLLEQALVNLLDNAIKYSPDGSSIELVAESDHDALSLRVIDHGTGIRHQDLPRIFERFYRTDAARTREHGGTGLGLAIVKHIARAHGGEVAVQSMTGQGSTFSMELPGMSADDER